MTPLAVVDGGGRGQVELIGAGAVDKEGHGAVSVHVEHVLALIAGGPGFALLDHGAGCGAGIDFHPGAQREVAGAEHRGGCAD